MKKYCLTDCFKRKMSTGFKNTIEVLTTLGILFGGIALAAGIAAGLGYFLVEIVHWAEMPKDGSYMGLGTAIIMIAGISSIALYHLYKIGRNVSKKVSSFAKERYEGKPYKCSIFEECTEEMTEEEIEIHEMFHDDIKGQ